MKTFDKASVPLVRLLHEGHQHVLVTLSGRAVAAQFFDLDPILRIRAELL